MNETLHKMRSPCGKCGCDLSEIKTTGTSEKSARCAMSEIKFDNIPAALRNVDQWVMWSIVERDGKPTKIPFQVDGTAAKSNEPETWTTFAAVREAFATGKFTGIGFVFTADDPYIGIDLDGCRDPKTGTVSEWAREIVKGLNTYAEVSPSQTGIKAFAIGCSPFTTGKKITLADVPTIGDKSPAIEIYDQLRYFAVTGLRVTGPAEPQERQEQIDWLKERYWKDEPATPQPKTDFHSPQAIVERARKYLAKLPPSISGQSGHNATFHAACVLILGFELNEADAIGLMHDYNAKCSPPWSVKDLERKVREAAKQPGRRGYLKNASSMNWDKIPIPKYVQPLEQSEATGPKITTLADATHGYLAQVKAGETTLYTTGIPDLDYALEGGIARGEMLVYGALPSHGKSCVALQAIHALTQDGIPCAMVSEEMSAMTLGKRTLQYITPMIQEQWRVGIDLLEIQVREFNAKRAPAYIIENCGTSYAAVEAMEAVVKDHGVQCIAVDYAQLLRSKGQNRYEQTTATSVLLRQFASTHNVILIVLCQLNRASETRPGPFIPRMADLKETGQFGQDADVICGIVWPYRLDTNEPVERYLFHPLKNRNRNCNQEIVDCRFLPARQMILPPAPSQQRTRTQDGVAY